MFGTSNRLTHSRTLFLQDLRKTHIEGRIFELLDKVVFEQAVFQLLDGLTSLRRNFFEPDPDQESTADMIALDACLTTLAVFKLGELIGFPVHLLNLSKKATRVLSGIVGHAPVRAVDRHLNPEQMQLGWLNAPSVKLWKALIQPRRRTDNA